MGIPEQTLYRGKPQSKGLETDQVRPLHENAGLKRLVAESQAVGNSPEPVTEKGNAHRWKLSYDRVCESGGQVGPHGITIPLRSKKGMQTGVH